MTNQIHYYRPDLTCPQCHKTGAIVFYNQSNVSPSDDPKVLYIVRTKTYECEHCYHTWEAQTEEKQ